MANTELCACCTDTTPTCYCPLTGVISTLSKKCAMQLINVVGVHGTVRYSTLENHLATASSSTLSHCLEELADAGSVTRTQYGEMPPRVEYELTDEGAQLRERSEPLLEWATNPP